MDDCTVRPGDVIGLDDERRSGVPPGVVWRDASVRSSMSCVSVAQLVLFRSYSQFPVAAIGRQLQNSSTASILSPLSPVSVNDVGR